MRYIDFMVFYTMANFKKKMDRSLWGSQLARAVFLASLNVSLIIVIVIEIICLFFRVDIADGSNFQLKFAIGAILNFLLLCYIYINKKRYEHITSPPYKSFKLSITTGVTISFLIFIVCLIGGIGIPVAISALLSK